MRSLGYHQPTPQPSCPRSVSVTHHQHAQQHAWTAPGSSLYNSQQQKQQRQRRCSVAAAASKQQDQNSPQPSNMQQLTCLCATAVMTLSSCLSPASGLLLSSPAAALLLSPAAAEARPRMTAEEQVSVDVFKKSTPSVVNVTNLTAR